MDVNPKRDNVIRPQTRTDHVTQQFDLSVFRNIDAVLLPTVVCFGRKHTGQEVERYTYFAWMRNSVSVQEEKVPPCCLYILLCHINTPPTGVYGGGGSRPPLPGCVKMILCMFLSVLAVSSSACQCFSHAFDCYYDPEVERKGASLDTFGRSDGGGVCINCQVWVACQVETDSTV